MMGPTLLMVAHMQAIDVEADGMLLRPAYPAGMAGPLADLFNRRLGGADASAAAGKRRRRKQAHAEEAQEDGHHEVEEAPAAPAPEDGAQAAHVDDIPFDGAHPCCCLPTVFLVINLCYCTSVECAEHGLNGSWGVGSSR